MKKPPSLSSLPMLSVLIVSLSTSCSSALNVTGDLDGEAVPAAFSGAFAVTDVQQRDFAFGVWSTLSDTCGLAGALMGEINGELANADDTLGTIEDFFDDVPGDFWLMTTLFSADGRLDGDDWQQASAGGFVCHFTDGPDLSNTPSTSCAAIDGSDSDAEVTILDDQQLTIEGELSFIQSGRIGRIDAGGISGTAVAPFCPSFDAAMDDFFDDCFESGGAGGCQAAVNAYVGSHTIQQD